MVRLRFIANPKGQKCLLDTVKTFFLSNSVKQLQSNQNPGILNEFKCYGTVARCVQSRPCSDPVLLKAAHRSSFWRGFKSQARNETSGRIVLWKRLAIVGAVVGCVGYSYYSIHRDKAVREEQVRYEEFKKAKLGGDWTLIDHHGKQRSSTDFRGQWILMYFGFTHCPDICPEELEKLVRIVKHFENDSKLPNMQPIFITLDPERDTPATIRDYLADFKCPQMVGFTAPTVEVIKEVATKYRAYFNKGIPDEDNDYIVDHTIIIYVINPDGEFVNFFDRGKSAQQVIRTVTDHIQKYNDLKANS